MTDSRLYATYLLITGMLLCASAGNTLAQLSIVRGTVTDADSRETLPGVNIIADSLGGTATDDAGRYAIALAPGKHRLTFQYMGYRPEVLLLDLPPGDTLIRNMTLQVHAFNLDMAVVSASRYEQRLSDVTVSMEVLRPDYIENINTTQLDEAIRLMPGVDVIDGQANIRGGSGYSYGAGSRVMLLVDELPMLTGDVNDVKWSSLPLENIGQVEIIKGASSSLYGSSALNGVINLRTASPGLVPVTKIELSSGFYTRPSRDELTWWWDRVPFFGNMKFSHSRKAGPFDLSIGASGLFDEGYRQENYMQYGRFNAGFRYNPANLKGLSVGFNTNFQYQRFSDFLIWQDADSGAFIHNPDAITPTHGPRFNLDPYAVYFDRREGRHSLRTRYYKVTNLFDDDPDKQNGSDYFFGEYQYYRQFRNKLHWTIGGAASFTKGKSNLYGNHDGSTQALYTQLDKEFFGRLNVSLGLRWERYTIDNSDDESRPVVRTGINYRISDITFLRASFGQGYRYPSMAEKYTATSLGSLNIFPNAGLQPEDGWSLEAGVRQAYRIGKWEGFIDLAGYWMEYRDMIEFIFGLYVPDTVQIPSIEHLGFKSLNIGDARINGIDLSVTSQGRIGRVAVQAFAGYTWMNPVDLSSDTLENDILKYRYRHSAKADLQLSSGEFSGGCTILYQSFMERIDEAFEDEIIPGSGIYAFPGLKEYRQENDNGSVVLDLRLGWQVSPSSKVSFFIKNLFNKEYMGRPGDIQPPRNISLQYILKI